MQGCRAGRHLPASSTQLLPEPGPSLRKLPKGHRFLAYSLKVACKSLIFCTRPHNYPDISILHVPRLMIISAVSFLMSSGVCVKPRRRTAVHFNPPLLLTCASPIFVILLHMLQDCGGLTSAGCQVNTKAALLSWKRKSIRKGSQDKVRTGKDRSTVHGQNRLSLGKLIYCQSNLSRKMRNKN